MRKDAMQRRTWLVAGGVSACMAASTLWASEARWPEERSAGVFRIHADYALDDQSELLEELSTLEEDLQTQLGLPPTREEIHLFFFQKRATYQAYLNQYFPKVPARRALFIKGRGPGMVFAFASDDFAVDVRHESTHALLHTWIDDLPLWLDEGLAEYFEVSRGERAAKNPYASTVRWNVRLGYVPDLEKLERLKELEEFGRNEYRDAWSWVHFLMHHSPSSHRLLTDQLRLLASGEDPGRLSEHLRRRLADADTQFVHHFRRWQVAA